MQKPRLKAQESTKRAGWLAGRLKAAAAAAARRRPVKLVSRLGVYRRRAPPAIDLGLLAAAAGHAGAQDKLPPAGGRRFGRAGLQAVPIARIAHCGGR